MERQSIQGISRWKNDRDRMIYLLITADDFGKNSDINRAVRIGVEEGILTSASLMVIGDKWKEAVKIAQEKNIDIGLHVSLTEGKSISLNKTIKILPSIFGLYAQFCKISWIEEEISLQFKRLALTGIPFSHVDSHHHVHIHPKISKVLLKTCRKYKIKSIRVPYEPSFSFYICNNHPFRNIFYRTVFYLLSRRLIQDIRLSRLVFADGVFGLYRTGEITEKWMLLLINRLNGRSGIFEIYLHPADKKGTAGYEELKAITSQKVRDKINEIGARLIGFSKLPELIHV